MSSKSIDTTMKLPFIERPDLTSAIRNSILSRESSIAWIQGGTGCGKTEAIYRTLDKLTAELRKMEQYVIILDFEKFTKAEMSQSDSLSKCINREIAAQLSRQVAPHSLFKALETNLGDFETLLKTFAQSRPLWSHFVTSCKSPEELWRRIMTNPSTLEESLPKFRLSETPTGELEAWLAVLKGSFKKVSVVMMHLERIAVNVFRNDPVIGKILSPGNEYNLLIECNDSLKSIWNICDESEGKCIIEVPDLPIEALQAVFVPSLLSDELHVKTLYSIFGGRVGLLGRLVDTLVILNEEQKLLDQAQEHLYRSGKENRPSNESRELQINPLVHKREVAVRDCLISGPLKDQVDEFQKSMHRTLTQFSPLSDLRNNMSEIELNVLFFESVRTITETLSRAGSLAIPTDVSPLDLSHPVILGLLSSNILALAWLPYPRIVAESPLKLFLLSSWYTSEVERMSFDSRACYNLIAMRNKVHIEKQIEKLVH